MRIAFVTSCMEPGRDGVGDYVRDLAAACVQRGHACVVTAINDRYVDQPCPQKQTSGSLEIEVLRLPASSRWPDRSRAARAWLEQQPADWLSLQFVPYGFHPRGVVLGLGGHLAPLLAGQRIHLMLHELWIGMERGASVRHRLVGWAQRHAVLSLVRGLSPRVIHTSNPAYRALSFAAGVPTRLLPLFGNIPVAEPPGEQWLDVEAAKLGVRGPRHEQCWWFGMFGTLHSVWSPEPLFSYLDEAAKRSGRRVVIGSIGRLGHGEPLWRQLQARYASRFSFATFGERNTRDISAFLQSVDFGIATTPWEIIGKSGTVAAMLDHGLPVIVSRDDVHFGIAPDPKARPEPLLRKMDSQLPEWLIDGPGRRPARARLPEMTDIFLADLQAAADVGSARLAG